MIHQILIGVTGLIALYLTLNNDPKYSKYAPIFGLLGQPSWLYSAYYTEQYGVLIVSVCYTLLWLHTFKRIWIK